MKPIDLDQFEGHTAGSWYVFEGARANDRPGIEAADRRGSIVIYGEYADCSDDGGIRGSTPEEMRANARLIAAAPDLLDELKRRRAVDEAVTRFVALAKEVAECETHGGYTAEYMRSRILNGLAILAEANK